MLLNEVKSKVCGLAVVSLVWCTVLMLPGADDKGGVAEVGSA